MYRLNIKSFPYCKHLLLENYVEYKHIYLPLLKLVSKICYLSYTLKKKNSYSTYFSFLVIKFCNQAKTLCSPCNFIFVASLFLYYLKQLGSNKKHWEFRSYLCHFVFGWVPPHTSLSLLSSFLKMKPAGSFETSDRTYTNRQRNIPDDLNR